VPAVKQALPEAERPFPTNRGYSRNPASLGNHRLMLGK
jgi:hypothetical protein